MQLLITPMSRHTIFDFVILCFSCVCCYFFCLNCAFFCPFHVCASICSTVLTFYFPHLIRTCCLWVWNYWVNLCFYFSLSLTLEMPQFVSSPVERWKTSSETFILPRVWARACVCIFHQFLPVFTVYSPLQHHTTNDLSTNSWILNNSSSELLN